MNPYDVFPRITTFIFDVDGVFTNSNLLITEQGELLRQMSVRDGYAIKRALRQGYNVAIITGGNSAGVEKRLNGLGVTDVYSNVSNKYEVYKAYLRKHNIPGGQVLYMGDDLPDLEVMKKVGLACCPADATHEIAGISDYVSPVNGGHGCVRDVIEKVLRLHEKWMPEPVKPEY